MSAMKYATVLQEMNINLCRLSSDPLYKYPAVDLSSRPRHFSVSTWVCNSGMNNTWRQLPEQL